MFQINWACSLNTLLWIQKVWDVWMNNFLKYECWKMEQNVVGTKSNENLRRHNFFICWPILLILFAIFMFFRAVHWHLIRIRIFILWNFRLLYLIKSHPFIYQTMKSQTSNSLTIHRIHRSKNVFPLQFPSKILKIKS